MIMVFETFGTVYNYFCNFPAVEWMVGDAPRRGIEIPAQGTALGIG